MLWILAVTLEAGEAEQKNGDDLVPPESESRARCVPTFPLTLAAYQAWFGLDSHIQPPPYISTDPAVLAGHVTSAMARGIAGFVVDWYGPQAGVTNDLDREFIDLATSTLLRQSQAQGFCVALMYDEGTVSAAETSTTAYTARAISDLLYARQYLTMPAYLRLAGNPALFVFAYDEVDAHVDWDQVRSQLGITVTLLDRDPNPGDPDHDDPFDGFYAWVQPTAGRWSADGTEWGEGYLKWFYDTMATPAYAARVAVGGVWPGFDDALAPWGSDRYIWPRCGQTWHDTWRLAAQYDPPIVMIDTWNDLEEGTGVEYGTGACLTPSRQGSALPGGQVVYTHTIANTARFTDTLSVTARSSGTWPIAIDPVSATLAGRASATLVVSQAIPLSAASGTWNRLFITVTSGLSTAVHSSVVNTTTAAYYDVYLPLLPRTYPSSTSK